MNTLEPMNTLGQRIAHYRKSSALTQEELAAAEAFLASPGLNTGDALDKVDIPKIIGLAASGAAGKLVEVTSSEGDVVEITVE